MVRNAVSSIITHDNSSIRKVIAPRLIPISSSCTLRAIAIEIKKTEIAVEIAKQYLRLDIGNTITDATIGSIKSSDIITRFKEKLFDQRINQVIHSLVA
ncbi:hypothetical protein NHE_0654 [Neorickettsia helminthoeca str. Oregon]|uniref:Uncharacterized protein n=1 Tax=Neorickettsia helminthoeca str. Oregon TaxID=1286528 RepID=X5H4I2_9RICK|nr:hypothetical protein NHE_0654 [Neorickettsia helminthoeca str. Oregon]